MSPVRPSIMEAAFLSSALFRRQAAKSLALEPADSSPCFQSKRPTTLGANFCAETPTCWEGISKSVTKAANQLTLTSKYSDFNAKVFMSLVQPIPAPVTNADLIALEWQQLLALVAGYASSSVGRESIL